MTSRLAIAPLLLCGLCAVIGCGKQKSKPAVAHPVPVSALGRTSATGRFGGRLTIAIPTPPRTFNPVVANDSGSDAIVRLLFAPLVSLDGVTQEPQPALAESWTNSPDGKMFIFNLRKGVYWSDGAPFTADDVVFTWNEVMYNPNFNRLAYDLFRPGGRPFQVTRIDDYTVQVATAEVFAPFVEFFGGQVLILPRHVLQKSVRNNSFNAAFGLSSKPEQVVGCGPFRLKEASPGKPVVLERNSEYWAVDKERRRLPYIDEVVFAAGNGPGSDAMLLLNSRADLCDVVRLELIDLFAQAPTNARIQLLNLGSGNDRESLWFNQNTVNNVLGKPLVPPAKLKWFRNKKFRQAVSCAVDRDRIAKEAYQGRANPIVSFISEQNRKWYNPNVPRYTHDVEKARALLAEIGIQDRNNDGIDEDSEGNLLEITVNSNTENPAREKAAMMVCEDLRKIGIKALYNPMDFASLRHLIDETFEYEAAMMGLGGGGIDPASGINVLKSTEDLHQWFPLQKTPSSEWEARIDALMDAQMHTLDFTKRKQAFDEVQAIMAEEMPMIYTVSPICYAAVRDNIANLRPSARTPYRITWNIDELFFKAGP